MTICWAEVDGVEANQLYEADHRHDNYQIDSYRFMVKISHDISPRRELQMTAACRIRWRDIGASPGGLGAHEFSLGRSTAGLAKLFQVPLHSESIRFQL